MKTLEDLEQVRGPAIFGATNVHINTLIEQRAHIAKFKKVAKAFLVAISDPGTARAVISQMIPEGVEIERCIVTTSGEAAVARSVAEDMGIRTQEGFFPLDIMIDFLSPMNFLSREYIERTTPCPVMRICLVMKPCIEYVEYLKPYLEVDDLTIYEALPSCHRGLCRDPFQRWRLAVCKSPEVARAVAAEVNPYH